jgi:HTH-type transcriptional regulator/antitoxin HigA
MAKKAVRPIRTKAEYEATLDEIERYFERQPKAGKPEADRFDLLALVIEDYEKKHWPIDPPDPVEAIRYRMETGGFTQSELGSVLGSRQRASDILSRKRPVTLEMAWTLHRKWGVPAEALIKPQIPASPVGRRVSSAAIQGATYDASNRRLTVTFVNGRRYVYERVPKSVYEAFRHASSKGKFFNRDIRDRYAYRDITQLAS